MVTVQLQTVDKLCHPRSVAYSAKLVQLNKRWWSWSALILILFPDKCPQYNDNYYDQLEVDINRGNVHFSVPIILAFQIMLG